MACKDAKGRLRVAAGVGVTADTLDRMQLWWMPVRMLSLLILPMDIPCM